MITNVEIDKKSNESNASMLRRFTKAVQGSGVLPRVRSIRYSTRKLSPYKVKMHDAGFVIHVGESEFDFASMILILHPVSCIIIYSYLSTSTGSCFAACRDGYRVARKLMPIAIIAMNRTSSPVI